MLVIVHLYVNPLEAASSCHDSGCARLFSGNGLCVDMRNITATNLEANFDLSSGGFSGSCSCLAKECLCRCFKRKGQESRAVKPCKQNKACTKSGGSCYTQGSGPDGAAALGWCNKKKKCRCYKAGVTATTTTPKPTTTCNGECIVGFIVVSTTPFHSRGCPYLLVPDTVRVLHPELLSYRHIRGDDHWDWWGDWHHWCSCSYWTYRYMLSLLHRL